MNDPAVDCFAREDSVNKGLHMKLIGSLRNQSRSRLECAHDSCSGPQPANDALTRRLRIALVTETFLPEVNGVAMTLGRLVTGSAPLVITCRWWATATHSRRSGRRRGDRILRPGLPIPGYAGLQLGLPCRTSLLANWRGSPPDVVHVATEGPMGVSARSAQLIGWGSP